LLDAIDGTDVRMIGWIHLFVLKGWNKSAELRKLLELEVVVVMIRKH